MIYYVLDGRKPRRAGSRAWAKFMSEADRTVKRTLQGDVEVSTVFLGLDHNFHAEGPPILFETMVFTAGRGGGCRRYATWEEAVQGHDQTVARVFAATPIAAPS